MNEASVTRHLAVHGRVQGVGYRYAMVRAAQRFGVTGWVRNRVDGTVEAVVQGPPAAVESIVAWARAGPDAAIVDRVEVAEAHGTYRSFESRPTA